MSPQLLLNYKQLQNVSILITCTGVARLVLLFCHKKCSTTQLCKKVHLLVILALLSWQSYLGIQELSNFDFISMDVWFAMLNVGYIENQKQWDKLMKMYNCCGVYGTKFWTGSNFLCTEDKLDKIGCMDPLIHTVEYKTTIFGAILLVLTLYQWAHTLFHLRYKTKQSKRSEETESLLFV
ncbi:hypothetical protein B566_EDAN013431 [Ephemera danica]|nr:hypothetical protein B566_EDAN013431 [Ephemera danica]